MGYHSIVRDLHADHVAAVKPVLLLLQGGVFCLLLIGAVNLSNLFLLRAGARAKEFSVRRALGASRIQIARLLIVETSLLAVTGGAFGIAMGAVALKGIATLTVDQLPVDAVLGLDLTTCQVALGVSVVVGLLLAVPSTVQALHGSLPVALAIESRGGTTSRSVHRLRHTLIVAQIALAFVLLAGACLLGISFTRVLAVKPGFDSENVITGTISLPWTRYKEASQRVAFIERLFAALRGEPGVIAVGLSNRVPFAGSDTIDFTPISIEGRPPSPNEGPVETYYRVVSGDYFKALGIPLLKGRFINDRDSLPGNKMCVIDEVVSRRYWPQGDAIGHRVTFTPTNPSKDDFYTIVGIVGSVKQNGLDESNGYGAVYSPNVLFPALGFTVALRTAQASEAAASSLRAATTGIDSELPLTDLKTMATRVSESLVGRRIPLLTGGVFAAVALVLAAIGIYGVLAYQVTQRRREIGVRMALGAQPDQILRQFLRLGAHLLAAGLSLGLAGAWMAGKLMATLLFNVDPMDPLVIGVTALVLAIIGMLACWIPSHRASLVAPAEALRSS